MSVSMSGAPENFEASEDALSFTEQHHISDPQPDPYTIDQPASTPFIELHSIADPAAEPFTTPQEPSSTSTTTDSEQPVPDTVEPGEASASQRRSASGTMPTKKSKKSHLRKLSGSEWRNSENEKNSGKMPLTRNESKKWPERQLPAVAEKVFTEASRGYETLLQELDLWPGWDDPEEHYGNPEYAAFEQIHKDLEGRTCVMIRAGSGEVQSQTVDGALKEACRRVLAAYSIHNPGVGYSQGMNYVCAALLLETRMRRDSLRLDGTWDEPYAFYVLAAFSEVIFPDLWCKEPPLLGVTIMKHVWHEAMMRLLPEVETQAEERLSLSTDMLVLDGLMCALAKNLAVDALVRVWQEMYQLGREHRTVCTQYMIGAICYILHTVESELLQACEYQEIGDFKRLIAEAAEKADPDSLLKGTDEFCDKLKDGWGYGKAGTFEDMYYHFFKRELQMIKQRSMRFPSSAETPRAALFSNLSWRGRFEGTMTESDKEWMESVIKAFEDRQGPGKSTFELREFEQVMSELLPLYRHDHLPLSRLFKVLDTDNSGTVSLGEICMGLAMVQSGTMEEKLSLCFRIFDVDSKGYLTLEEVSKLSRIISRMVWGTTDPKVADAEADAMFATMDVNGDGRVNLEEFSRNTALRPAVFAFFREVGIAQQSNVPEPSPNKESLPAVGLSAHRVSNQLKRFLPSHKIKELEPLLQKHLLAISFSDGAAGEDELHQVTQLLHSLIGESVLAQATERATEVRQGRETFVTMGVGNEATDELQGLLAGESVLLDLPECTLIRMKNGKKTTLQAQLTITSYRLLIKFADPSQRSSVGVVANKSLAFIPIGAISKMRDSFQKRVISVRTKYTFPYVHIKFEEPVDFVEVRRLLGSLMLTSISSIQRAFAFAHANSDNSASGGWHIYDPESDFRRMGVPSMEWRFCTLNDAHAVCQSYPQLMVVPSTSTDITVRHAVASRRTGRIPILMYWSPVYQIGLLRCEQFILNLEGKGESGLHDSQLVLNCMEAASESGARVFVRINRSNSSKKQHLKARGQFQADILHIDMPDPSKTIKALYDLQSDHVAGVDFQDSKWRKMLSQMLQAAFEVQAIVGSPSAEGTIHGGIAMIDCKDGRTESAALSSLVQLLLDPFARTIWGFEVLLEKEWASMGYPFNTALAHSSDDWFESEGSSAFFLLWLDAVHQLVRAQPTMFEFDDRLLLSVGRHAFSCRFGNFLADSDYERQRVLIAERTISMWSFVNAQRAEYVNANFEQHEGCLLTKQDTGSATPRTRDAHAVHFSLVLSEIDYWHGMHCSMNGLNRISSMHKEITKGLFAGCGAG